MTSLSWSKALPHQHDVDPPSRGRVSKVLRIDGHVPDPVHLPELAHRLPNLAEVYEGFIQALSMCGNARLIPHPQEPANVLQDADQGANPAGCWLCNQTNQACKNCKNKSNQINLLAMAVSTSKKHFAASSWRKSLVARSVLNL